MLVGEKLPGFSRWTGRVSGPQRSQSLCRHRPPGVPGLPRPRSHSSLAAPPQKVALRGRRETAGSIPDSAGGDGARAPRAARPSRAAPPRRPALTLTPRTRAPARPLPLEGRGFSKGGGIVWTPRRLFLLWLSPAPPARAPACGVGVPRPGVPPKHSSPRARRETQGLCAGEGGGDASRAGPGRRGRDSAPAAAGQRLPAGGGGGQGRGRLGRGLRGTGRTAALGATPLPSSAEAPAARRGPGRARLTSSILSGAGGARGARGEGRPPRGLRRARAGSPCARPPASLTETPEATGSAGAPSAGLLQVWVPCPTAGQSQRRAEIGRAHV